MIPIGAKLTPPQGSEVGTQEQRKPTSKFFFSETGRDRALIFGMKLLLVDLYHFIHVMPLGVKTGPTLGGGGGGSQFETIRIKKVEFILWGK